MITDGQLYVRCDGCGSFVNSSESQAHQCPPQQQHPAIGGRTELTNRETERLDFVHNTIHQAICDLAGQELEWDAETIGAISDLVEGNVHKGHAGADGDHRAVAEAKLADPLGNDVDEDLGVCDLGKGAMDKF